MAFPHQVPNLGSKSCLVLYILGFGLRSSCSFSWQTVIKPGEYEMFEALYVSIKLNSKVFVKYFHILKANTIYFIVLMLI